MSERLSTLELALTPSRQNHPPAQNREQTHLQLDPQPQPSSSAPSQEGFEPRFSAPRPAVELSAQAGPAESEQPETQTLSERRRAGSKGRKRIASVDIVSAGAEHKAPAIFERMLFGSARTDEQRYA
eukprot:782149-Rhodomonas_salina.5